MSFPLPTTATTTALVTAHFKKRLSFAEKAKANTDYSTHAEIYNIAVIVQRNINEKQISSYYSVVHTVKCLLRIFTVHYVSKTLYT